MSRAIQLLGKCYSASLAKAYLHLLLEFIATLDDVFSRPLIIKYSHQADVPLQTLKDGFDNSKRTEQSLRLTQSGWWDELWVCMQSYMFIGCSIFKEGSDLDIEIYQRHSRRQKILTLGHASGDKFLCKANIKFDDLWKHLALESQKTTRWELIFALIASNILSAPQPTSRWISLMQFQYSSSGSLLRYALDRFQHEDSLLKFNRRLMTVTWAHYMPSQEHHGHFE